MSERKNITRNARRPLMKDTPYLSGKSSKGNKSEKKDIETMEKLDSWKSL